MSPSPGLAPVRARSLSGHCIDKSDHSVPPPTMAAAERAIVLPKQAIPCGLTTSAFLSECKRALCLKPASDCLRTPHCAKKHASLPFYSAGPNPAPALRAGKLGVSNKTGVALGHRSVNRQCGCRTRARLSAPRWEKRKTLLLAIGHAAGNLFSEDRRIFICARQCFGGGRCPWDSETDNHVEVDQGIGRTVSHATPEVGNGLFAIATSIDPQCRHFATGPYPADVFDGVSRKRDEAVPAQSARHDPARSRPLSRAEGDLAVDRQRELIGALPRTRFPAPPMPPASRLTVACSL